MVWNILIKINPQENQFKFWSYSDDNWVAWGRIGTNGQRRQYPDAHIYNKIQEKINEGYRIYAQRVAEPSPQPQEAREWWALGTGASPVGSTPHTPIEAQEEEARELAERQREQRRMEDWDGGPTEPSPNSGVQVTEPVPLDNNADIEARPEPVSRPRRVQTRQHHTVARVEEYKTNAKGEITNYRSGYTRNVFDEYVSNMEVVNLSSLVDGYMQVIDPSSKRLKEAKKYFAKIPASSQLSKPNTFEELRDPLRPTYALVFLKKGNKLECISIYGVNRTQGYCDFLALKSSANYRRNLLKKILLQISNSTRGETITFKLKSTAMIDEIKEVADYFTEESSRSLTYRLIDLRNGISLPQAKPLRWIE